MSLKCLMVLSDLCEFVCHIATEKSTENAFNCGKNMYICIKKLTLFLFF